MANGNGGYVFDKGNVIGIVQKWGDKQIVVAEKTFKDKPYLDIRLYEGNFPKSGMSLSYRDDFKEVDELYLIIRKFYEMNNSEPPTFHPIGKDSVEDPF